MGRGNNIPKTGRDIFFTPAGDNTLSGRTNETPVADLTTAIARVNALPVPPGPADPASINASVTGLYDAGVVIPAFTTANCASASIISTDAVLVEAGGRQSIRFGSLVALSDGATCLKIDGKTRVRAIINSCIVPKDGIGFDVSGTCDEIFVELVEGIVGGSGGTMISHTATSLTPIVYDVADSLFTDIDQTFMNHNPGPGSAETIVNVSAVQPIPNVAPATTAGSMVINALSGTLVVNAGVLVAVCSTTVSDGALVVYDVQALFGSTIVEAGGTAVYKSLGTLQLNVDLQGPGAIAQVQTESMVGDYTVADGAQGTLKTDVIVGDIDVAVGGRLFCIIDTHVGTVTPSDPGDGRINGIINGVRYGNWRALDVIRLNGFSMSTQDPVALDTPLQIEFGAAQGTGSDPVQLSVSGDITINVEDQYYFTFALQYGRTGAGNVSWLFFWVEVNGTQVGNSVLVKLDNANSDTPFQARRTFDLVPGDVVSLFIVRDSQGNNSGGLVTESATIAINDSPSASVIVEQRK